MLYLLLFLAASLHTKASEQPTIINKGWQFKLGDIPEAANPSFDANGWETVNVPHDWAFENGYSQNAAQQEFGAYAGGGIGWYQKELFFSAADLGSGVYHFIDFEAVYMNSEVWINGHHLGKRPYGYISFSYDLSPYIKEGRNVVSVRVDNTLEPSARWYHGCGIYGNVSLRKEQSVYFEKDGTFITADTKGKVKIQAELQVRKKDSPSYDVLYSIKDANGKEVASTMQKAVSVENNLNTLNAELKVRKPSLWCSESPALYTLTTQVVDKQGVCIDQKSTRFGFRSVEWDIKKGFLLNGKQVKINGVCEHLEGGPTGAISTPKLIRWKIQQIKDMGSNAIRVAHNPQLPLFYDLCDEMGILVMDEIFDGWHKKAACDYGMQAFDEWWERDVRAWIRRDRNHPSIIIYSIGNETKGDVAKDIVRVCHEEDNTRLVTSGHSNSDDMDVLGINGNSEKKTWLETFKPTTQTYVGTENPHTWQVRGFYRTQTWYRNGYPSDRLDPMFIPNLTEKEIFTYDWIDPALRGNKKQVFNSSYDNATVRVSARHMIAYARDHEWFSGCFRWTGFDYLGEAGFVHGGWPFRIFQGGALDVAGFKKDLYYLYQSEWADIDMVHLLPHWTHPTMKKGELIPVWAYTSGDEVELFLNGKSLGKKQKGSKWDEIQCEWLVPWTEGTLEAVAYRKGKEIARTTQKSAGAPSQMALTTDTKDLKADEEDIAFVTMTQQDADGTLYPYGENRVFTKLFGAARMLSFESGSPVDGDGNFGVTARRSFFGLNRAFIQSTDTDASAPVSLLTGIISGDKKLMLSDKISIQVKEIALRGALPNRNISIFYTTDGSTPTTASSAYNAPFAITLGTTVKAIAVCNGKTLLRMQETFSADQGLYWGK